MLISSAMARRLTSRPILLWLLFALGVSGCTIPERPTAAGSHHHNFIAYWPVPAKDNELCLAVKDNIDVKGVVTTAGSEYVARTSLPAAHAAACLALARARHICIVGKANLSELTLF